MKAPFVAPSVMKGAFIAFHQRSSSVMPALAVLRISDHAEEVADPAARVVRAGQPVVDGADAARQSSPSGGCPQSVNEANISPRSLISSGMSASVAGRTWDMPRC
jgi:hypothetical protein